MSDKKEVKQPIIQQLMNEQANLGLEYFQLSLDIKQGQERQSFIEKRMIQIDSELKILKSNT